MKLLYCYNKDTLEFTTIITARRDVLESEKCGYDVFAIPQFATEKEVPTLKDNEVAVFNPEIDNWEVKESYKGKYKLNIRTGAIFLINDNNLLKSYEKLLKDDEAKDALANPLKYEIINGELVNISKTQKYKSRYNKKEYERKIKEAQEEYELFRETPIEYRGHGYLPRYIDDYAVLQFRAFPIEIWDASGEYSKVMNEAEFKALKLFLEKANDQAYKKKKDAIKRYKEAIKQLGE